MTPTVSWLQTILAVLVTLAFCGFIAALFFFKIPEENRDTLMLAAGVLYAGAQQVWSYFFGSSSGSKEKQQLIADKLEGPKT